MPEPVQLSLRFLGEPMGTLAFRPDGPAYALELDPAFLATGHDLSPLSAPRELFQNGPVIYRPQDTPFAGGLPGLIADSLPDSWGERLMQIEHPEIRTVMGKLSAIGVRGFGALTYEPMLDATDNGRHVAHLRRLAVEAAELATSPRPLQPDQVDEALTHGGSTLGGAMPKVSAYLPAEGEFLDLDELIVGGPLPKDHVPGIVKFCKVDDEGGGAVEFAFHQMARAAGIRVPRAALINDGKRRHFAVARFDRVVTARGQVARKHVHSLSGFLHRRASDGQIDYEELMRLTRTLGGAEEARECLRRIVFNLLSTNRDDHGRNHAFLYDEVNRTWTLSPAFDLTPNVANVLIALRFLGSTAIPTEFPQLLRLAEIGGISSRIARQIYDQVKAAVIGGWRNTAAHLAISEGIIAYWDREMSVQTKSLQASAR